MSLAAPEAAPLETHYEQPFTPSPETLRYQRRELLWKGSSQPRVRNCGRAPVSVVSGASIRSRGLLSGYAGLQHCGSVWICPVCAARILVHRALEIGAVLGEAVRQGHSLGFVTLTMRHDRGQDLDLLWSAAQRGWQRAISGKGWASAGLAGWVRVWEITYGRNGWHVHVHLVLVLPSGATEVDLDALASGMFRRWSGGVQAAGLRAPLRQGQDWHIAAGVNAGDQLGEYLAKTVETVDVAAGLGLELTHGQPGRSRQGLGTLPVWTVLDESRETGEIGRWREWEKVSKGKRQVGWSRHIRERFAASIEELSDDEIVRVEVGSADDDVVRFTYDQWREIPRVPLLSLRLLEATRTGGRQAVTALLDEHGIDYQEVNCEAI